MSDNWRWCRFGWHIADVDSFGCSIWATNKIDVCYDHYRTQHVREYDHEMQMLPTAWLIECLHISIGVRHYPYLYNHGIHTRLWNGFLHNDTSSPSHIMTFSPFLSLIQMLNKGDNPVSSDLNSNSSWYGTCSKSLWYDGGKHKQCI